LENLPAINGKAWIKVKNSLFTLKEDMALFQEMIDLEKEQII